MRRFVLVALSLLTPLAGGADVSRAGCSPNHAWQDYDPALSPNGRWLAFVRDEPGCAGTPPSLWFARADGAVERRVATQGYGPITWSPDSAAYAFVSRDQIMVAAYDNPRVLVAGWGPAWSPRGNRIAYVDRGDVWTIGPDGFSPSRLTADGRARGGLAWSPDGLRIAYESEDGIAVVETSGSSSRLLTSGGTKDRTPAWAPDGWTIAFASSRDGDFDIYLVGADENVLRSVTRNSGNDTFPAWRPDGRSLAWVSDDGEGEAPWGKRHALYVAPFDGSEASKVAFDLHPHSGLSWARATLVFSSGRLCDRWGIYDADGGRRLTNRCEFRGTSRRDVLRGSAFKDFLYGFGGDDLLDGLAGVDEIRGGIGDDTLRGGNGEDVLLGAEGDDVIDGGLGADWIEGGPGRNRLFGGSGADEIRAANRRRDVVDCGTNRRGAGPEHDLAYVDRFDSVRHCESLVLPG